MKEDNSIGHKLESMIKVNASDQRFLLRYHSRQPIETRIEAMVLHRKVLHQLKGRYQDTTLGLVSYAALILVVKIIYNREEELSKKRFDEMSLDEIADLSLIRIKKFEERLPSSTPKRNKLIHYWAVVKTLRAEKKSFRFIKAYLYKEYSFDVGHTLIADTWNELEK